MIKKNSLFFEENNELLLGSREALLVVGDWLMIDIGYPY
jgi:hypothetical protein